MKLESGPLTSAEAERLIHRLSWVRPLEPYPGWHFDMDWDDPALEVQLRRAIWNTYRIREPEQPVVLDWYDGLRVQTHWGTDESKQLYVGGCIEPNEFAFLAEYLQPGMVFFDIGANNGLYTLFAARRVGRLGWVWAFEPSSREFGRLQANIQLNQLTNVRAEQVALADVNDTAEMKIAVGEHAGHNTLGLFAHGTELLHMEVVCLRTLDRVVADAGLHRIDVMKLDVEGAELKVLEGARTVLREISPLLLLEVLPAALRHLGGSPDALRAFLKEFDYELCAFHPISGRPAPVSGELPEGNLLAVPRVLSLDRLGIAPVSAIDAAAGCSSRGTNLSASETPSSA